MCLTQCAKKCNGSAPQIQGLSGTATVVGRDIAYLANRTTCSSHHLTSHKKGVSIIIVILFYSISFFLFSSSVRNF